MEKTRYLGLLMTCLALGAIAAAPLSRTPENQIAQEQEENEQEENEEEEKKYTNKEVMKLAHKDGLLKKVATHKASDKEKKQLVALYKAMAKNKPNHGDEESWKERTRMLVEAAEAAVKGEEDAGDQLLKASDCKACHNLHK